LRITVNLVACGIGFGLFQTPNNTTIVSTAPPERGGAASGMIGVARLMGQCFGAALVALLFKVIPDQALSIKTCQYIAVGFAVVAAALSISRVKIRCPGEEIIGCISAQFRKIFKIYRYDCVQMDLKKNINS
jgi:MFS family permease